MTGRTQARLRASVALAALACLAASLPAAPADGVVSGLVADSRVGNGLPGAQVRLVGTSFEAVTDRRGFYRIAGVPAGEYTAAATYLGFDDGSATVSLAAGSTATANIRLRLTGFAEEVTVTAPLLQGQAKALSQQQNANNILNVVSADQIGAFPDSNAAEAVQRVPGVSIERDQGEGRYVLIRGTEARLNSMLINGERIPSPEGDIRSVALDVVPADLLQSIEVSKSLTPDMDADAIGGAVNLVTGQAPESPRAFLSAAAGYNDVSDDTLGRLTGSFARRFSENKVGLVLAGSYFKTDRGSENFEAEYDDGDLDTLEYRHYTVTRERLGLNGALDFRLGGGGLFYLRGIYNDYSDQEYRRAKTNAVGDGEIDRELKDRLETQTIASFSAGGAQPLGGGLWSLDYTASWSYASEDEPDAQYTLFRQEDVLFDPNVAPGRIDPDDIQANALNEDFALSIFDEGVVEDNFTSDRDLVGGFNLKRVFASGSRNGILKFGGKYRDKRKERDNGTTLFESDDDLFLPDFADPGFAPSTSIIDGRYVMGPFVDPARARSGLPGLGSGERDPEADLADFDAREKLAAGFVMAEVNLSPNLMILPGLRYEHTDIDYTGYEVLFDEDGDYRSTEPVTGAKSYGNWLPHLHLRYRTAEGRGNLRAAVTRTLARPNYFDLVPYQLILEEDGEIERGNPALESTRSWNFDLLYEHFLPSVGVVSAGVFHKRLDDYIYFFTFEEDRGGSDFDVIQPLNGEKATLTGVELALQTKIGMGFGFLGNYTWTESEAEFPGREGSPASLPGQSKHVGNAALTFETAGFSSRLAVNLHGKYISEVGGSEAEDVFYDDHVQLDVAASYRFSKGIRLFVEVNNLTNEPLRYYEGSSDRPIQEEYYKWWGTVGFKWDF